MALRLGRRVARSKDARPRIVFVSGEPDAPGHRYRVVHVASALSPEFFETVVIRGDELPEHLEEFGAADILWIWRAPYWDWLAAALEEARDAGARVVYDVDDLVFDPELARPDVVDALRTIGAAADDQARVYADVRRALLEADHCTVPTERLAREVRRLGLPTTVVPNGFDVGFLRTAEDARRVRESGEPTATVRIGYAAGTFTHQRDLAVAVPALARLLAEHPEARFVTFDGAVDISEFPELRALARQVELRPLVPLDDLPREYARFDLNIAPLEVGNPFCESKSELKFFEAALCGAATVASPTETFAAAIRSGRTGFLALDDQSWHAALSRLLDARLRRRVANRARREAVWRFGPEHRAALVNRLVANLLETQPRPGPASV